MKLEKTLKLTQNREVKIVVNGEQTKGRKEVTIELDFFVKDVRDPDFRPLIGTDHPQYWKLKNYPADKSQYLQLEYSGVSRAQLNDIIDAFKAAYRPGFTFKFRTYIGKRIKYLKGIRIPAESIRRLSTAG